MIPAHRDPIAFVLNTRGGNSVSMPPDWLVTVPTNVVQYVLELDGPVRFDTSSEYTNAADVPWWVCVVLALRFASITRTGPRSLEANAKKLHDEALDDSARAAFKRGTADPEWAAALLTAWTLGGRVAGKKFMRDAQVERP